MIDPADGWDHVEMRLRKGEVHLAVTPVRHVTSMGTAYTDAVSAERANGFEVALRDGPSPTGGPSTSGGTSLATFADVQDAWELAAIATHWIEARSAGALTDRVGESGAGSARSDGPIADRSPIAVFADVVGDDTGPIEDLAD